MPFTPIEYSFATPADLGERPYRAFCRRAGLPITPDGWGLLHCRTDTGQHVTAATENVGYLRLLVDASGAADGVIRGQPRWQEVLSRVTGPARRSGGSAQAGPTSGNRLSRSAGHDTLGSPPGGVASTRGPRRATR